MCERLLQREEKEHLVLVATEHRMRSNSFKLQKEMCRSGFMKSTGNARDGRLIERFYRRRPGDSLLVEVFKDNMLLKSSLS